MYDLSSLIFNKIELDIFLFKAFASEYSTVLSLSPCTIKHGIFRLPQALEIENLFLFSM